MDLIQLIITIVGFVGLLVYQHFRIKGLKDKIDDQTDLIKTAKIIYDTMNPELLKLRIETYEKILEEKKKFEEDKIRTKMIEVMKQKARDLNHASQYVSDLTVALMSALFKLPSEEREKTIDQMNDGMMKGMMKEQLPRLKQWDEEREALWTKVQDPHWDVEPYPKDDNNS